MRRFLPSRRGVLVVGGVVLVLAVLVLLLPTSLVDPLTRRVVGRYGGTCVNYRGLEVDSGAWPTVARWVSGELRDVSVRADEMDTLAFTYHDVSFSAAEVEAGPLGGLLSDRHTRIRGGEISASVRFEAIESYVAASGTTMHLRQQGETLVADVDVPVVGPVPTTVDITPVDGDMELVFAPLDVFTLPPVRVDLPAPLSLATVEVQSDAIRFDSTVDGVVPADEFGCDVGP